MSSWSLGGHGGSWHPSCGVKRSMLVPRMFGENFMKIGALKGHQDSTCPPSVLLESWRTWMFLRHLELVSKGLGHSQDWCLKVLYVFEECRTHKIHWNWSFLVVQKGWNSWSVFGRHGGGHDFFSKIPSQDLLKLLYGPPKNYLETSKKKWRTLNTNSTVWWVYLKPWNSVATNIRIIRIFE